MNSVKTASPAAEVCTAMMRLGTHMASVFDREMMQHGLTQAQFRTLLTVSGGPLAPTEVARRSLLERATTSLVAQRMVQAGWLQRQAGASRRTHNLALTKAGESALRAALPGAEQLADEATAVFSADELATLLALLKKLESHVRVRFGPAGEKS